MCLPNLHRLFDPTCTQACVDQSAIVFCRCGQQLPPTQPVHECLITRGDIHSGILLGQVPAMGDRLYNVKRHSAKGTGDFSYTCKVARHESTNFLQVHLVVIFISGIVYHACFKEMPHSGFATHLAFWHNASQRVIYCTSSLHRSVKPDLRPH